MATAAVTIGNLDGFLKGLNTFVDEFEQKVVNARRSIANMMTETLLVNIPVWSGRTVRSLHWSNDGTPLALEVHPDRGDTSSDGRFKYHQEFGATSKMPLGSEPMRPSAEAEAYASLDGVSFDLAESLYVTVGSTAWPLVEQGEAPTDVGARNSAVVSEIAIATVKSSFEFLR